MTVENLPVTVHTASEGGRVVGYAVESMTKNGFSGVIRLMVGFAPDGQILNIRVLEQAETPGLGTKMVDAGNSLEKSFVGRNPGQETRNDEARGRQAGREEGRRRRGCPDGGDDFVAGLCRCRESGL